MKVVKKTAKKSAKTATKKAAKKTTKKASKKSKKSMKTKKAMKAKKRESKIAKGKRARAAVFNGKKVKTMSGLTKDDLVKSKNGKLVSKKFQQKGKKLYQTHAKKWIDAVQKARKVLKITGFQVIGG